MKILLDKLRKMIYNDIIYVYQYDFKNIKACQN